MAVSDDRKSVQENDAKASLLTPSACLHCLTLWDRMLLDEKSGVKRRFRQAEDSGSGEEKAKVQGSQTLLRGLDMLDQVIDGPIKLADLSARMGLTRSTAHRLANALIDRGFLTFLPREGYQLGPKLLQLGFLAQSQTDVVQIARPHIDDWRSAPRIRSISAGSTMSWRSISTRSPAAAASISPAASAIAIRSPPPGWARRCCSTAPKQNGAACSRPIRQPARPKPITRMGSRGCRIMSRRAAPSISRRMRTRYAASPRPSAMRRAGSSRRSASPAPRNIWTMRA
jgi:hypothetical protein